MEKRERIALDWNVPVQVTLKYSTGKAMEDRGYGPSVMYSSVDNKVLFVDLETSTRISSLQMEAGESFLICKQKRDGKTRTMVWLSPATETMRAAKATPPSQVEEQLQGTLANLGEGKHPATPRPMPPAVARRLEAATHTEPQGTGTNGPVAVPQRQGAAVPIKATYGAAMQEFLLMAGRATCEAERKLAGEGVTLRVDSRDVVALATTCFIQAAREGWIVWRPGEAS